MTMTEIEPSTMVGAFIDVATLKAVAVAASADQARPTLCCVAFVADGDRWQVQATDSYVAAWTGESPADAGHHLVNAKALLGAIKTVGPFRFEPLVAIQFEGDECVVLGPGGTVKLRKEEGQYPRLGQIVDGLKEGTTSRIGFTPITMGKVSAVANLLGKDSTFVFSFENEHKAARVRFCANPDVHMVVMPCRCP